MLETTPQQGAATKTAEPESTPGHAGCVATPASGGQM